MFTAGLMNFLFSVAMVLIIPLFQRTEWLRPARYGITMAVFTTSMILGMATTAAIKIPAERRLFLFGLGTVLFIVPLIFFPFFNIFWPMLICMVFGGYFNSAVNVLINSVLQLGVPQQHRGKVYGLLEALTQGLTLIGLALGGILGEFFPLKWVIGGAIVIIGLYIFPQLGSKGIREFFPVSAETVEENGDFDEGD